MSGGIAANSFNERESRATIAPARANPQKPNVASTFDRHLWRTIAAQLAYDLGVRPSGTEIDRALIEKWFGYVFGPPTHSENPKLESMQLDKPADVIAMYASITSKNRARSNPYHKQLLGLRPPSKEKLNTDIITYSPDAIRIKGHVFWPVVRSQPTNLVDYFVFGQYLPTWHVHGPHIVGNEPFDDLPLPTMEFRKHFLSVDTLESLTYFLLEYGATRCPTCEWNPDWSFEQLTCITCRLACVPPFRHSGSQFALDVLGSALVGRNTPQKWRDNALTRMARYARILENAYPAGILVKDGRFPQGDRWKELALLHIADEKEPDEVAAALRRKNRGTGNPTLCAELIARLKDVVAPRDPWWAPAPSHPSFSRAPPAMGAELRPRVH